MRVPTTRRSLVTACPAPRLVARRVCQPRVQLALTARRAYAAAPEAVLSPAAAPTKTKKKRAGFFRWTWRLTKLGTVALVAWISYDIYLLRTPDEQFDPDPSKKTLVILGGWCCARRRAC